MLESIDGVKEPPWQFEGLPFEHNTVNACYDTISVPEHCQMVQLWHIMPQKVAPQPKKDLSYMITEFAALAFTKASESIESIDNIQ